MIIILYIIGLIILGCFWIYIKYYNNKNSRILCMRYEMAVSALPQIKTEHKSFYTVEKSKICVRGLLQHSKNLILATPEDAEKLQKLANSSYNDMEKRFPTVEEARELITQHTVFFYKHGSDVVGCFAGVVHNGGYLECCCLCVDPKYKKQGIGCEILECTNKYLQAVGKGNLPAFFMTTNTYANKFLMTLYMRKLGVKLLNNIELEHDHVFIGDICNPKKLRLQILYCCPTPSHMTKPAIYLK